MENERLNMTAEEFSKLYQDGVDGLSIEDMASAFVDAYNQIESMKSEIDSLNGGQRILNMSIDEASKQCNCNCDCNTKGENK